ncbi:MAG: AHH domain-containing protein [Dechloromonas sp.]|uniref:RHS repeat-associated core domain-containing protein n=1 Tax=Dechloromonas sp. TaxID=1917218 RepID=UPI0027F22737|nr:RHS repeat-associated core domain-containing protein [Dechloromonas sp.]MBT9519293.1 AHH domain-containing protein [Dechloromonas sp.]
MRSKLLLIALIATVLAQSAGAAPSALSRLPDDTVQRLRDNLAAQESPARAALRQKLDELREGSGDDAEARRGGRVALRAQGATSLRAEMRQLREPLKQELAALKSQVQGVAGAAKVAQITSLASQLDERFDRVENALKQLEQARNEGEARIARKGLAALLNTLRAPAEALPKGPVPTLSPRHPQQRAPGQDAPSQKLPQYAHEMLRAARLADNGGFGFVKVAATLPPVASETTTDCNAVAADLADDGVEVRITPEIQALAKELQYSPARILRWMLKEVAFEPYWGSLKGSLGVLQTRSGNATDQSSLLVALLRASNVPARFVRGTVALFDQQPSDNANGRAQRWLGTKNYSGSAAYLNQGVPAGSYSYNGTVQGIKFDHVWVQACVPFAAYRGNLADSGGYRWVPLDASIKDHDYQAGIAVNVPLDSAFYSSYLATRREQLPPEYFADLVETAARSVKSDAAVADVPYRGTPRALRLDVLPSTPQAAAIQFTNWPGSSAPESSTIPDAHRHKFAVTVQTAGGATLATHTVTFPQKVFGKITVAYTPDAASQALWNSWSGAGLPAGSVNVYPQIKIDGSVVATGSTTLGLGSPHKLIMKLTQGEDSDGKCINDSGVITDAKDGDLTCQNKTVYTNIKAGGYYALGVNAKQTSDASLEARAKLLAAGVQANPTAPTPASGAAYDATVGELLHLVLQTYIQQTDEADQRIAELRGFRSVGNYDIGLTSSDIKTDYAFDLPLTVKPAGVYIDFKGGLYGFAKMNSAADFSANRTTALFAEQVELAKLSIYSNSALEHRVWQEALRTDAVSTVRGLQYAGETGNTLVTFTSANIGQYATLMQMSGPTSMAAYQTSITAEVASGATVIVPRAQITYPDPVDSSKAWRGAVYMSENATSGAYGALIDGSISGGRPMLYSTQVNTLYSSDSSVPTFANQSNDGLGLLTTLSTGIQGSNSLAAMAFDPVNMLTGNLTHNETDLSVKGRGLPILFARWYNSGDPKDGPLGNGWTHSFNHQVKLYGVEGGAAKVSWLNGSGGETWFSTTSQTSGDIAKGATLISAGGVNVEFTRVSGGADDGKYRIRERNGLVYLFASTAGPNVTPSANSAVVARLLSITDRNGNALTLNYSGTQLSNVTDSLGRTVLTFTWSGNHIIQVADNGSRIVKYDYTDGNSNLNQVTDAANQNHAYSYYTITDGAKLAHRLKRHTLPRGNGIEFEYYSNGQVFRHTPVDTGGALIGTGAITFHYNLFTRDSWTVNERGYEHHTTFDSHGNPIAIVEENGAEHSYTYDPANPYNRLTETDSVGRRTAWTYNSQKLIETQTLPSGTVLEFRDYNNFAQPQRIKDARGNWTWLKYNATNGNLTDRIALRSGVAGTAGAQPASTDIVAWTKTAYDTAGNPTTTTRVKDFAAGSGPSLTLNWDANKLNVQSLTRAGNRNGSTVNETSPTFGYDSLNRLTSGVDARWYPTTASYDALDRLTSTTDALGKTHHQTYDANSNLTQTELVDGGARIDSAATQLDARDRPIALLDYAGNRTAMSYDEAGNLVTRTSPDNFTLGFEYDPNNRLTAAFDAEGNRVHTQLDTQGRPLALTDPNGNTVNYSYWGSTTFDGRLKRSTQPAMAGQSAGRATEMDYDANGNVIQTRSIAGDGSSTRQSYRFYDELGRITRSVSTPDDSGNRLQTCYSYDKLSNLIQLKAGATTDVNSSTCPGSPSVQLTQTWDDFGAQLTRTDALNRTWTYAYDNHGNLLSSQSPEQLKVGSSTKTAFTYDPSLNGLLKSRTVPGTGAAGQSVTYTRNALGQVTRAETRDGSNALIVAYDYGYDVAHRLASITDSRGNKSLAYTWTPGGRLAKLALADNGSVTHQWDYKYDASGRPSALIAPNGQTISFALDAGGRLIERSFGNTLTSKYVWQPEGSLSSIEHLAGSSQLAKHAYTYDVWGNRSTASDTLSNSTQTKTYGYDALDRLKSVANGTATQDEGYSFDLFGNRLTKSLGTPVTQSWTSTYDTAHQLTQVQQTVGGSAITTLLRYDDNGNLKKLCDAGSGTVSGTATDCSVTGTGSATRTLTWNGLDQLVALARAGSAALNEAYAYDDAGRRLSKTSAGSTAAYLYDGEAILGEWADSVAGSPSAVYVQGGTDDPLMRLTGNSGGTDASVRYYAQDGIGSVSALYGQGQDPTNVVSEAGASLAQTSGGGYTVGGVASNVNALKDGDRSSVSGHWTASSGSALDITFAGSRTISEVVLIGNPGTTNNPTPNDASTWSGTSTFDTSTYTVQTWTGSAWNTVGTISGNVNHIRRISFAPTTTSKVRIIPVDDASNGQTANDNLVSLSEVEIWTHADNLATQRFDAWGSVTQSSGSIPTYGYTGREPDASGLIFYRARYYHPGLGRFASRDPIGMQGGINPYAYAGGNPVLYNDPSGLIVKNAANFAAPYYGAASDSVQSWWKSSMAAGANETVGSTFDKVLQGLNPEVAAVGAAFGSIKAVTKAEAASSKILGTALENDGFIRAVGDAAHHIVAGGAQAATEARAILKNFGVGLNDAANGVFLPATKALAETRDAVAHAAVHTKEYYDSVTTALLQATSKEQIIDTLSQIRARLLNGGKP